MCIFLSSIFFCVQYRFGPLHTDIYPVEARWLIIAFFGCANHTTAILNVVYWLFCGYRSSFSRSKKKRRRRRRHLERIAVTKSDIYFDCYKLNGFRSDDGARKNEHLPWRYSHFLLFFASRNHKSIPTIQNHSVNV